MLEKQDSITKSHIAVQRAIDELRRQMGVIIQMETDKSPEQKCLAVYPIEFLADTDESVLRAAGGACYVLLSGSRGRSLKLGDSDESAWAVKADSLSLADMRALADPLNPAPPPRVSAQTATPPQALALKLAKYASLLPALLCMELSQERLPAFMEGWQALHARDIASYITHPLLDVVEMASARLPTVMVENGYITSFRARYGTAVHLALLVGNPASADQTPLVRIHSSCVTGDILGSLRCDCGDQLKLAVERIAQEGCGVLLYLHQEGRGIGINNKLRAYQLQEDGMDTYDANLLLGFEEDERDFTIASAMLAKLGIKGIRLLTNNPKKLAAMERSGIQVTQRVPLVAPAGRHNHAYLEAKATKSGHMLKN